MIKIPAIDKGYFCSKCGAYSVRVAKTLTEDPENIYCVICNSVLVQCIPVFLHYICETCKEEYEAELEWLEVNNFRCPTCKDKWLDSKLVNVCSFKENTGAFHVVVDGSWDGVPVGKKIQEKNEQVKNKFAGYSYEQASLKKKIQGMVNEKLKQ